MCWMKRVKVSRPSRPEVDQLLTVKDLALRWQKPEQWVYSNWRRIGLEPIALGQQLRFETNHIRDWEDKSRLSAQSKK